MSLSGWCMVEVHRFFPTIQAVGDQTKHKKVPNWALNRTGNYPGAGRAY
jgi:hypothetical protein